MSTWPITISLPQADVVSGVTTWGVQLANALARAGRETRLVVHKHRHRLAAIRRGARRSKTPQHHPIGAEPHPKLEVIHAPRLEDPASWRAYLQIYRELLPTVLLPFTLAENYAVAAALATVWPERIRVVGWIHSDNPYDYETLAYYEPIVHRYVAVSHRCNDELIRRMPTRAETVEHLPYGVSIPDERPRPPLSDRPLRLIYAGRVEQGGKRVFDLVSLAELLDRRGVHFELRLVGDGPQTGELRARIDVTTRAFTNPRNGMWLDAPVPHDQMPEVWSRADAALVVSNREGFSLSMIESMACGCVPVVSRVDSGVTDILEEGHNGLTFPVGDVEALAGHIAWLSRNEARMRQMGTAARQSVKRCSDYGPFLDRVLRILDSALAAPERPWPATRPLCMNSLGHRFPTSGNTGDKPVPQFCATVPSDAGDRLRRVLRYIAEIRGGPVAIYGAGSHTRALAPVWADSPVEIVAVADDDDSRHGGRLWGWPIVSPDAAHTTGAKSIIISSWMYESEIWQRRRGPLEAVGLRIFRLYAEPPGSRCGTSFQPVGT